MTHYLFLTPAMAADLKDVNPALYAALEGHGKEQLPHGTLYVGVADDLAMRITCVTHRDVQDN